MMQTLIAAVDWTAVFTNIIIFVATGVVLPKIWQFIKLSADDKTRGYLDVALRGAIRAAINAYAKTQNKTPFAILLAVANDHAVREEIMKFAQDYLKKNVPNALKRLSINGGLADIIMGRIDDVTEELAKSLANMATSLQVGIEKPIPIETTAANFGKLGSTKPADTIPEDANEKQEALPLDQRPE